MNITGTYRTHETSPAAMTNLLTAHPHLEWREVDGRREVKIEGVVWTERVDGAVTP